jgi:ribosomal protein S18 acetylase RimI-like enzyme
MLTIRPYRPADLEAMQQITIEGFDGTAIEQSVEIQLGLLANHDWRWRKARQIEEDCERNPGGVFVAEQAGQIVGYITTTIDRESSKGRIPNLAVAAEARRRGIGRRLIEQALDYFRRERLAYAMIETMTNNPAGQHLYPACGFQEVCRQIHYAVKL